MILEWKIFCESMKKELKFKEKENMYPQKNGIENSTNANDKRCKQCKFFLIQVFIYKKFLPEHTIITSEAILRKKYLT